MTQETFEIGIECTNCHKKEIKPIPATGQHLHGMVMVISEVGTIGQLDGKRTDGSTFCSCPPETRIKWHVPGWFPDWIRRVKEQREALHGTAP